MTGTSVSPGNSGPVLVAETPAAGVALQNGTPVFLSWTAPNDGNLHEFELVASLQVTSGETGGAVGLSFTFPGGAAATPNVFAAGLGAGTVNSSVAGKRLVAPGTTVTLAQTSALTAGAAQLMAQLWAS